jgi:hypothetical protein
MSQMFTCGLSDLLLLAVASLVAFVLREYILKVHILVIWTLTFYCFRLKNMLNIFWDFWISNHCWAFQVYFDFQNFHLTTRLRWPHCYTPNVHLWSVWFVITCGRIISCFCIARIHFKSSHTRQFWT